MSDPYIKRLHFGSTPHFQAKHTGLKRTVISLLNVSNMFPMIGAGPFYFTSQRCRGRNMHNLHQKLLKFIIRATNEF